jgi:hypothetical protein
VDVPDEHARGPNLGCVQDPKTWKGPLLLLTNPEEIAHRAKTINIQQYHQAVNPPFGSGPLATLIGRNGDSPIAPSLLGGTLPEEFLPALMPETIRVLQTLTKPVSTIDGITSVMVTEEEFVKIYHGAKEGTWMPHWPL